MKAVEHGVISLAAGTSLWLVLGSPAAGLSCFLAGFLLDIDHLVDYLLHHPRSNTVADLVDVCENCRLRRVVLPLHSWELACLVFVSAVQLPDLRPVLTGTGLGLVSHLAADQWSNPVTGGAYFLTHRVRNRFHRTAFFDSRALDRRNPGRFDTPPGAR